MLKVGVPLPKVQGMMRQDGLSEVDVAAVAIT